YVNFKAGDTEGQYKLLLTNLDAGIQVSNSFQVKKDMPFIVKRQTATRINPFKSTYQVNLSITAKQAFFGQVEEFVQEGLNVDAAEATGLQAEGRVLRYTLTPISDPNLGN